MSLSTYDDVNQAEHECPRPLREQVGEFTAGAMFFSPAGRWETITDRSPFAESQLRVQIRTDRTGPSYAWTFWHTTRLPYLPPWQTSQPPQVAVFELDRTIDVEVTTARGWGNGHTLISARQIRGSGWQITDHPDGATVEDVTVASKARARAEVNRRARAHAKRLGVALRREAVPT